MTVHEVLLNPTATSASHFVTYNFALQQPASDLICTIIQCDVKIVFTAYCKQC